MSLDPSSEPLHHGCYQQVWSSGSWSAVRPQLFLSLCLQYKQITHYTICILQRCQTKQIITGLPSYQVLIAITWFTITGFTSTSSRRRGILHLERALQLMEVCKRTTGKYKWDSCPLRTDWDTRSLYIQMHISSLYIGCHSGSQTSGMFNLLCKSHLFTCINLHRIDSQGKQSLTCRHEFVTISRIPLIKAFKLQPLIQQWVDSKVLISVIPCYSAVGLAAPAAAFPVPPTSGPSLHLPSCLSLSPFGWRLMKRTEDVAAVSQLALFTRVHW